MQQEPDECNAVDHNGDPKHDLKGLLSRFVPEHPLRDECTGPTTNKRDEMERALGSTPAPMLRSRLVDRVEDKGSHAGNEIEPRDEGWRAVEHHHPNQECGKHSDRDQVYGSIARKATECGRLMIETDIDRAGAALLVFTKIISNRVIVMRSSMTFVERPDVHKDFLAALLGRDESVPSIIIPIDYLSLQGHGKLLSGEGWTR